jgi:hypothetical protein
VTAVAAGAQDARAKHPHVRLDRSAAMDDERISALASRHADGSPPLTCDHAGDGACDAAALAAGLRGWMALASELLDCRFFGYRAVDIEAADALALGLGSDDSAPVWSRDPDDPARITVHSDRWRRVPRPPLTPRPPSATEDA